MTAVRQHPVPAPPACRAGRFGNATHLICRACGAQSPLGPFYACMECFGPLEVGYDVPDHHPRADRGRPEVASGATQPLLPVPADIADLPLHRPRLHPAGRRPPPRRRTRAQQLWVKDDSGNPTHSFKDRVVAVALSAARELGLQVLACPSTGNLANAVAAAAARAGIRSVVFVPEQPRAAEDHRLRRLRHDPDRGRGHATTTSTSWPARSPARRRAGRSSTSTSGPYYAEGSKTLAYEIAEQLGWRLPDQIVIPVASGSQLTKIDKGFARADQARPGRGEAGTRSSAPRPPAARRSRRPSAPGHDVVAPVKPDTIAKSLAIGNPADGPYVLDVVRRTGGVIADVDDEVVVREHPAAGPDRGHLRRDRRRGDHRA